MRTGKAKRGSDEILISIANIIHVMLTNITISTDRHSTLLARTHFISTPLLAIAGVPNVPIAGSVGWLAIN